MGRWGELGVEELKGEMERFAVVGRMKVRGEEVR